MMSHLFLLSLLLSPSPYYLDHFVVATRFRATMRSPAAQTQLTGQVTLGAIRDVVVQRNSAGTFSMEVRGGIEDDAFPFVALNSTVGSSYETVPLSHSSLEKKKKKKIGPRLFCSSLSFSFHLERK